MPSTAVLHTATLFFPSFGSRRHRLMIFRDQGVIEGDRHVEISHWFGPLESTFYKHPRSPHPDVFRVSNDPDEGCTGVGRTGWHVDGSFQRSPFAYSLYHIISVPRAGDTVFAPLHEIINSLPPQQRARWERLWMCSDRRGGLVKPLVYTHPRSGLDTLCFHLGMTAAFVWDHGTPHARTTGPQETEQLLQEMEEVFKGPAKHFIYSHKVCRSKDVLFAMLAQYCLGQVADSCCVVPLCCSGVRVTSSSPTTLLLGMRLHLIRRHRGNRWGCG